MTKKAQYKMIYQVYADGYRSQTNIWQTAKKRADTYYKRGFGAVMIWESTQNGRSMIYQPEE